MKIMEAHSICENNDRRYGKDLAEETETATEEEEEDDEEDDEEGEVEGEVEDEASEALPVAKSLFDDYVSANSLDVWDYMQRQYRFNPLDIVKTDYEFIMLMNFLRCLQCNEGGACVEDAWNAIKTSTSNARKWREEANLIPYLENDRLLWDYPFDFTAGAEASASPTLSSFPHVYSESSIEQENEQLKRKIHFLSNIIQNVTKETLFEADSRTESFYKSKRQIEDSDNAYFDSYASLSIHREMILDDVRTNTYRQFILKNTELFKDKVILDVGCGSGILSLFAAQAGAKLVVAVDAAKAILDVAQRVIYQNGMQEVIKLVFGKMEDIELYFNASQTDVVIRPRASTENITLLPFQCDVIISEWMGYCLLYESMVYTVLEARDRFLRPSGHILPNKAVLGAFAADFTSYFSSYIDTWDQPLHNCNLMALKPIEEDVLKHPEVCVVDADKLCSGIHPFCVLNLSVINREELMSLRCPFQVQVSDSCAAATTIGIYFDCLFTTNNVQDTWSTWLLYGANKSFEHSISHLNLELDENIMRTSPLSKPTHWKQSVFHLYDSMGKRIFAKGSMLQDTLDAVGPLRGIISLSPHPENNRHLCVAIELDKVLTTPLFHFDSIVNFYEFH